MAKQMDKLSLEMIECEKAGFGCHYGAWKATQPIAKPKPKEIPEGWHICAWCGKAYKPNKIRSQKYCEPECQHNASAERYRRRMQERKEAEKNASCC